MQHFYVASLIFICIIEASAQRKGINDMVANLSEKAQAFLAKNPYMLGNMLGMQFYEDPINGDKAPIFAIMPSGRVLRTPFWCILITSC